MVSKTARKNVVSPPRQLGDFVRIRINGSSNPPTITSTDENCNTHGTSRFVESFRCFQFWSFPGIDYISTNDGLIGWNQLIDQAIQVVKCFHLNDVPTESDLLLKIFDN